jgi:hypothetical protein
VCAPRAARTASPATRRPGPARTRTRPLRLASARWAGSRPRKSRAWKRAGAAWSSTSTAETAPAPAATCAAFLPRPLTAPRSCGTESRRRRSAAVSPRAAARIAPYTSRSPAALAGRPIPPSIRSSCRDGGARAPPTDGAAPTVRVGEHPPGWAGLPAMLGGPGPVGCRSGTSVPADAHLPSHGVPSISSRASVHVLGGKHRRSAALDSGGSQGARPAVAAQARPDGNARTCKPRAAGVPALPG